MDSNQFLWIPIDSYGFLWIWGFLDTSTIVFGDMDGCVPCKCVGLGTTDGNFPYKSVGMWPCGDAIS
jgi:hypothetical protein